MKTVIWLLQVSAATLDGVFVRENAGTRPHARRAPRLRGGHASTARNQRESAAAEGSGPSRATPERLSEAVYSTGLEIEPMQRGATLIASSGCTCAFSSSHSSASSPCVESARARTIARVAILLHYTVIHTHTVSALHCTPLHWTPSLAFQGFDSIRVSKSLSRALTQTRQNTGTPDIHVIWSQLESQYCTSSSVFSTTIGNQNTLSITTYIPTNFTLL